jgi:hypothetical protein
MALLQLQGLVRATVSLIMAIIEDTDLFSVQMSDLYDTFTKGFGASWPSLVDGLNSDPPAEINAASAIGMVGQELKAYVPIDDHWILNETMKSIINHFREDTEKSWEAVVNNRLSVYLTAALSRMINVISSESKDPDVGMRFAKAKFVSRTLNHLSDYFNTPAWEKVFTGEESTDGSESSKGVSSPRDGTAQD